MANFRNLTFPRRGRCPRVIKVQLRPRCNRRIERKETRSFACTRPEVNRRDKTECLGQFSSGTPLRTQQEQRQRSGRQKMDIME